MRVPLFQTWLDRARRALGYTFRYRDADTGHWVSADYAKANPKTTVRVRTPNPGKGLGK